MTAAIALLISSVRLKSTRPLFWVLLTLAAVARLFLQMAAMPPYAGLDEIYHVARLAFVLQEGRNPTTREASIPPYLNGSIHQSAERLPSFAQIAYRWPDVVRNNPVIVRDHPLTPSDLRPYRDANYEAQQPSLYYSAIAPLAHLLPSRTAVAELRLWRFVSVVFGVLAVIAAGWAARRLVGTDVGLAAALVLLLLPTWMTLIVRAANDALSCALIATAFAVSAAAPRKLPGSIAEGLLWGGACAVKLYGWPVAVAALPLMWWRQRAPRARVAVVCLLLVVAGAMTLLDLRSRTQNAVGVVAFDRPGTASYPSRIDIGEIVRVTLASAAWTSGQHWDALRPAAIALYAIPLLAAFLLFTLRHRSDFGGRLSLAAAMLALFGCAQAANVALCVLARRSGNPVPIGGKEGWYWYAMAPPLVALLLAPIAKRSRWLFLTTVGWLLLWDVVITEGALFHDYAGMTSPSTPSVLFRWGPLMAPFTARLSTIGVGPFASQIVLLRVVQAAASALLLALCLRKSPAGEPPPSSGTVK